MYISKKTYVYIEYKDWQNDDFACKFQFQTMNVLSFATTRFHNSQVILCYLQNLRAPQFSLG